MIFCNTDESEDKERKYLELLRQQQVAGILLVPACSNPNSMQFIRQQRIPVVLLDRTISGVDAHVVRCDSVKGADELVSYLLELGHRQIAILNGPPGVSTADDRLAGYQEAMQEAGLDFTGLVYSGVFTHASGYEMAKRALSAVPRPTALFAANNFIANGVLKAVWEHGLRVPEDISVVCFDELPPSVVSHPFFTAIAQPAYELGHEAAKLLIAQISGNIPADSCQEIILPTELIVRETSVRELN